MSVLKRMLIFCLLAACLPLSAAAAAVPQSPGLAAQDPRAAIEVNFLRSQIMDATDFELQFNISLYLEKNQTAQQLDAAAQANLAAQPNADHLLVLYYSHEIGHAALETGAAAATYLTDEDIHAIEAAFADTAADTMGQRAVNGMMELIRRLFDDGTLPRSETVNAILDGSYVPLPAGEEADNWAQRCVVVLPSEHLSDAAVHHLMLQLYRLYDETGVGTILSIKEDAAPPQEDAAAQDAYFAALSRPEKQIELSFYPQEQALRWRITPQLRQQLSEKELRAVETAFTDGADPAQAAQQGVAQLTAVLQPTVPVLPVIFAIVVIAACALLFVLRKRKKS